MTLNESAIECLKTAQGDWMNNPHMLEAVSLPIAAGALYGIPAAYGALSSPKGHGAEGASRAMGITSGTFLGGGLGALAGGGLGAWAGGPGAAAAGAGGGAVLGGILGHGLSHGLYGEPSWRTPAHEVKQMAKDDPHGMAGMAGGDPRKYSENENTLGGLKLTMGAGALTGAALAHLLAARMGAQGGMGPVTIGGAAAGALTGAAINRLLGKKFHNVHENNPHAAQ